MVLNISNSFEVKFSINYNLSFFFCTNQQLIVLFHFVGTSPNTHNKPCNVEWYRSFDGRINKTKVKQEQQMGHE